MNKQKITRVNKNIMDILNIFINNKNNKHVIKEAAVPGAFFIFPILNSVKKKQIKFFNHYL